MSDNHIGPALFFYVPGKILFHSCSVAEGEPYGDFIVYPQSHMAVWEKLYEKKYHVDFDYFPRGRIAYRKTDNTYLLYYDKCMESIISTITQKYANEKIILGYDEHYQCHQCNRGYVV